MNPMKRLGMVALVVAGMTLLASTAAQAKKNADDPHLIELRNTGVEPQATGQVILGDVKFEGVDVVGEPVWTQQIRIRCQNLTPGATYYATALGTFTADRKGNGKTSGTLQWGAEPWGGWVYIDVFRLEPDGSSTLVLTSW